MLAVPGVLVVAAFVAVVLHVATGMGLGPGFVVGVTVSATDPVAVTASIRRPGAPERLVPVAWAVIAILVGRAAIVYLVLGGASRLGQRAGRSGGIPTSWLHVMFWAGLRGAVAVALALSLPEDFPDRGMLQGITFGVVLFTLLVQATTANLVVVRSGARDDGD